MRNKFWGKCTLIQKSNDSSKIRTTFKFKSDYYNLFSPNGSQTFKGGSSVAGGTGAMTCIEIKGFIYRVFKNLKRLLRAPLISGFITVILELI